MTRTKWAAGLLVASVAMTLSSCSVLHRGSGDRATATPTPEVSPSVWVSRGSKSAVRTASTHLIRAGDLGGDFRASALSTNSTSKGVQPAACSALLGPALGMVGKPAGRASTSFVSADGTTAIAQTVAVYPSAAAAAKILTRATGLAKTCANMTAFGAKLTVKSSRTTAGGVPAVVLTQKQKTGAESITVVAQEKLVTVVAVAALLPGPARATVQKASAAAVTRLSAGSAG